jgi:hypothetical protein
MVKSLSRFYQKEYYPILQKHGGRMLGQTECERILVTHGATPTQARNAAYNFLHHGEHLEAHTRGSQSKYDKLLDKFDATKKTNMECIRYLESLGFSVGQAKNAAYKYRVERDLVGH